MIFFYVLVGLMQQFIAGRFGQRIVLEYVGVAVVTLLVIALAVR